MGIFYTGVAQLKGGKKRQDSKSDTDEDGYHTPNDEPENKGFYKDFRKDPDPGSGGSGLTA